MLSSISKANSEEPGEKRLSPERQASFIKSL
jgi:hypothetical protein